MGARTVNIGVIAYRRADMDHVGAWGYHGDVIDVHADDVERFDGLNVAPVSPAAQLPAAESDPGPESAPTKEIPAGNASQVAWREFALASGASEADVEGLTRDELRERFGPKE